MGEFKYCADHGHAVGRVEDDVRSKHLLNYSYQQPTTIITLNLEQQLILFSIIRKVVGRGVKLGSRLKMNIDPLPEKHFHEDHQEQALETKDPIQELIPMALLKKPDQFKQAFFSMACLSSEAFKAKNYQRAAQALTKCTDMLDLGRNILKDINRHWKLVIYANLACCYHYTRKLSKCNKFCQRIKEELEKHIEESPQKQTFLKLSRTLIKLKFQHCAILSQLQQHNRAFELCKSTIPMLKKYIQSLLDYVENHSSLDPGEKRSSETVQFSRQVHRFGQTLLTDLLRCLNQPLKKQERTTFYYWQKNPEQNEQQVKKKFIPHTENSNCKRSILGVSKSTHWIDEFNIGTIMHFSEMSISDFENAIPIEEYLFKDRLYELVIYCSMANFTMATQLRLIESTQQEKEEQPTQHTTLLKKYGYEEKSELFKLSQIYHLRSIEIMARNIKTTVPYITHIIRSYEKHYIKHKKLLEPIAAIVEESALSLNQSLNQKRQDNNQEQGYYQTTYNNYLIKANQQRQKNEYQSQNQPVADLLLESQRHQPNQNKQKTSGILVETITEEEEGRGQELKDPELNSWVQPPKQKQADIQLLTVKPDSKLQKIRIESPREELNNSGEYLKSHHRKQTSRVKKGIREGKSASKGAPLRFSSPTHPVPKQVHKKEAKKGVARQQVHNDYRLHGQRVDKKLQKKQRERKTTKKQRGVELQSERYGQKEIKIKTQSCTHIKVVYKKKK